MIVIHRYAALLDAQLAKLRLDQCGIASEILDEAVATSFPAASFADGVRLAVADEDETAARAALGLEARPEDLPPAAPQGKHGRALWAFIILAFAIVGLAIQADRQPKSGKSFGIHERDRNGDGKADYRSERNSKGRLETWEDNNFDGRWDVHTVSDGEIAEYSEADTDFDGSYDRRVEYEKGVPSTVVVRKGGQGPVLTLQTLVHGVPSTTLVDQDGDGTWDFRMEIDAYGREVGRTPVK